MSIQNQELEGFQKTLCIVSSNILRIMQEKKYSKTQLAKIAGITPRTLRKLIEAEGEGVSMYTLFCIKEGLGCEWYELMEECWNGGINISIRFDANRKVDTQKAQRIFEYLNRLS